MAAATAAAAEAAAEAVTGDLLDYGSVGMATSRHWRALSRRPWASSSLLLSSPLLCEINYTGEPLNLKTRGNLCLLMVISCLFFNFLEFPGHVVANFILSIVRKEKRVWSVRDSWIMSRRLRGNKVGEKMLFIFRRCPKKFFELLVRCARQIGWELGSYSNYTVTFWQPDYALLPWSDLCGATFMTLLGTLLFILSASNETTSQWRTNKLIVYPGTGYSGMITS